jgi:hypothetical protein
MTTEEWAEIERDILGAWGTSSTAQNALKAAWWRDRFENRTYPLMREVVSALERTDRRGWPSPGEIYGILKAKEADCRAPRRERQPAPDPPVTSAEYREIVESLCNAAHGATDPHWQQYLYELADFYDHNRNRVERGEPRQWPPPKIDGTLGAILRNAALGYEVRDDHDPRRVDEYEAA